MGRQQCRQLQSRLVSQLPPTVRCSAVCITSVDSHLLSRINSDLMSIDHSRNPSLDCRSAVVGGGSIDGLSNRKARPRADGAGTIVKVIPFRFIKARVHADDRLEISSSSTVVDVIHRSSDGARQIVGETTHDYWPRVARRLWRTN
jgi:hypothetical protein